MSRAQIAKIVINANYFSTYEFKTKKKCLLVSFSNTTTNDISLNL